jgi:Ca-activated chloride channel family protein
MTNKYWTIARIGLLVAIVLALTPVSRAQFQGGRAGVNPRNAQQQPDQPAVVVSTEPPPLETDLVLLTVSVTPPENKSRPTLTRDHFQVFEDGVEQKIAYFWEDSRPISVGFLVDDSDYMSVNHKMDDLRDALPTFLKSKKTEDEYFVFQFSTGPRMTVSYTTDAKLAPTNFRTLDEVADSLIPDTALYDAIYIGLESIKESANPRKALLVITAGGDKGCDGSKITQTMKPDQLLAFAMKQPVQIYSMMITDDWGTANAGMPCEQIPKDASNLGDLASATGGHDYLASNSQGGVDAIATEIARALKTQFLIGYKSTNAAKDGKRRGVKVKVNPPDGSPKLKVWTKAAYYAPKEKAPKTTN